MNLLPHKSWNVWSRKNKDKVRRDEEEFNRELEEVRKQQIKTDGSARYQILKQRKVSHSHLQSGDDDDQTDEATLAIPTKKAFFKDLKAPPPPRFSSLHPDLASLSAGHEEETPRKRKQPIKHINFFEDVEKQEKKMERQRKANQEMLGTALGEGSLELQKIKPFYLGSEPSTTTTVNQRQERLLVSRKQKEDPLNAVNELLHPDSFSKAKTRPEHSPRLVDQEIQRPSSFKAPIAQKGEAGEEDEDLILVSSSQSSQPTLDDEFVWIERQSGLMSSDDSDSASNQDVESSVAKKKHRRSEEKHGGKDKKRRGKEKEKRNAGGGGGEREVRERKEKEQQQVLMQLRLKRILREQQEKERIRSEGLSPQSPSSSLSSPPLWTDTRSACFPLPPSSSVTTARSRPSLANDRFKEQSRVEKSLSFERRGSRLRGHTD